MSEPKDSYYIVQSAAFIRPQQYIMSTAPGHYRITTNISQAFHFQTLSDAKAASDMPGYWSITRTWVPTLVLEVEPLAPGLPESTDLLELDEASIDPDQIGRAENEGLPPQAQEGLAASVTTASLSAQE